MRVVTLTLEITDEEAAALLAKFEKTEDDEVASDGDPGLDIRGVPWNGEFHAATKTKNQDGTWKVRRGHDKDGLAAYEKQYTDGPAPAPTPVEIPQFLQQQPSAVAAAAMPTMPTIPVRTVSYADLISIFEKTTERVGGEAINAAIGKIYADAGVTDVAELGDSETKRLAVAKALEAM